ncbi:hypothetical protein LguiA_014096 [Lonicera macranthoides]
MSPAMEQSPLSSSRRRDESEFMNLREWGLKARMISRENTRSRRFSASNISSLREDAARSFRSNFTISSTASSPGYTLKEEIDPSTYSFTSALRALQARSVNTWECASPDGFALNSKWNEAEKYICNPLSGEVPMECLSAKTLSGRSFRNLTSRITMSAPLIYPSNSRIFLPNPTIDEDHQVHIPMKEKKVGNLTRDAGTQSTPPDLTSSSPSPMTSPTQERSIKCNIKGRHSPNSTLPKQNVKEAEVKEITRDKEETKRDQEEEKNVELERKKGKNKWSCNSTTSNANGTSKKGKGGGGCLSLTSLWMRRRQREKHKARKKNTVSLCHINGCYIWRRKN